MTAQRYSDAYRDRPVCVTGGAGFIGSHLVERLVHLGAKVRVIDDLSNGRAENLESVRDRIRFIRGSILDPVALDEAIVSDGGVCVVFHEAALASVPRSIEEPALYHEVNATGTLRVLEAARQAGADRGGGTGVLPVPVIYAASSSAYGDQPESPKVESMCPQPLSPYAASKLAGESLLLAYANCYQLPCLSLRYFNIYGARQRADSPYAAVIPIFAELMRSGRKPTIHGDGSQTRDFTHVANAVHANLLAGAAPVENLRGGVVNVGCGVSMSVLELAKRIAVALDAPAEFEFAPPRAGDVMHSLANIERARQLIGYEPLMDFDEGLHLTLSPNRASAASA